MVDLTFINEIELNKYIAWLEYEINLCLEYDLPTNHLEQELRELREMETEVEINDNHPLPASLIYQVTQTEVA